MPLFNYLNKNGVEINEAVCSDFETYFSDYMQAGGQNNLTKLVNATLLFPADDTLNLAHLPNSIVSDYPDNYLVLTQAILYCCDKYDVQAQEKINAYLNHEKIISLAKQKNNFLIYMLSARAQGKKAAEKRKEEVSFAIDDSIEGEIEIKTPPNMSESDGESKDSASSSGSDTDEATPKKIIMADCQSFLRMLSTEMEDPVRQIALNHMVSTLMTYNKTKFADEQTTVDWLYSEMVTKRKADAWVFLNMVYRRYRPSSLISALECRFTVHTLASFNKNHTIYSELEKVESTYEEMELITTYQARGMRAGGFVLGVTAGAVILEWVAQQEFAQAWHIILLSGALCMTAGDFLGRFFYKSHNEELDKANKENYFNETYLEKEREPLSRTAYWGVNSECFFVFFETIAVGMFFCDLAAWALHPEDDYSMTFMLPGKYCWDTVGCESALGASTFILATAAVATLAVFFGLCMRSGHVVLDAKEATKYDHDQATLATMKTLRLSNTPAQPTLAQRVGRYFGMAC